MVTVFGLHSMRPANQLSGYQDDPLVTEMHSSCVAKPAIRFLRFVALWCFGCVGGGFSIETTKSFTFSGLEDRSGSRGFQRVESTGV